MTRVLRRWVLLALVLALVGVACGSSDDSERVGQSQSAMNGGQALVIRQVYPGKGTYSRAFVEIYNRGTAAVSLGGLSLQVLDPALATPWATLKVLPSLLLRPRQSFLVASAPLSAGPELPVVADLYVDGPPWGNGLSPGLSGVALVSGAAGPPFVDLVGFGVWTGPGGAPKDNSEGARAPYPSSTQSLLRKSNGAQDDDSNLNDFALGAPEPRNMESLAPATPVPGAPALDATTGTTPGGLSSFVYDSTNPNAPQTGVAAGTIDPERAGWIVGYVKDGSGAANAGVTVTVAGQGQYGQATTRADGRFDLVVNGSANFTLRFAKSGFFTADRRVYVGAKLTVSLDDVWLVAADSMAKVVTASSPNFQVAAANTVAADADSLSRTAVLMIPAQTKFKKGGVDLNSMTLRLTEYTAGANGINRMPASLTGSPAYTYAVEISADEASGQNVDFTDAGGAAKDVFFYVNDLVGFTLGTPVPTGYYDRATQAWVASKSGRVIQVVVTNGVATVDIDGGGVDSTATLDAFGIKSAELVALATQYGVAGQTTTTNLWRVPINHMTPYDCNWPAVPPPCEGGICPGGRGNPPPPAQPGCTGKCCGSGASGNGADTDSQRTGSIIGCDSGMLGETVNVAGTPYSLNYSSYRTAGYAAKRQLKIDLTGGATLHTKEKLISVDVTIAGRKYHREFVPTPNLSWTFQWDGLDAAGRSVVGSAMANVRVRSFFQSRYAQVAGFGQLSSETAATWEKARALVSYERTFQAPLMGQVPAAGWSLGDWTLSQHHFYDVLGNTVHLGSGGRIPSALPQSVISRIMGSGTGTTFAADGTSATAAGTGFDLANRPPGLGGVAVAPNGDVFMVDPARNRVRRIDTTGKIWTVAGSGTAACAQGVSTPPVFANSATDASLSNITDPSALAVGSDGSLYIATNREGTIRKASPLANGKYSISTFAGGSAVCNATTASSTDNVAATAATFNSIISLAVGPDGSVYVADAGGFRVRRIDPAGLISTIAGNGTSGGPARASEGKLATSVSVANVSDIAVGPEGTLYIAKPYDLLSVDKNGTLHFLNQGWNPAVKLVDGVPLCANVRETPRNCLIREEGEKVSMNVDVSERCGES